MLRLPLYLGQKLNAESKYSDLCAKTAQDEISWLSTAKFMSASLSCSSRPPFPGRSNSSRQSSFCPFITFMSEVCGRKRSCHLHNRHFGFYRSAHWSYHLGQSHLRWRTASRWRRSRRRECGEDDQGQIRFEAERHAVQLEGTDAGRVGASPCADAIGRKAGSAQGMDVAGPSLHGHGICPYSLMVRGRAHEQASQLVDSIIDATSIDHLTSTTGARDLAMWYGHCFSQGPVALRF